MQGEHETVEATSHSEDEDAGQAEGGEDDGKQTRNSGRRKRRTPAELNLLRDPDDVIVELTEAELQRLAGARKLHSLRYPTYIVCTHQNFQLRAIEGLQAVGGDLKGGHGAVGVGAKHGLGAEATPSRGGPKRRKTKA